MLLAIRSEMDKPTPEFKSGDTLISANMVNYRYIEYLIDRPVLAYILTDKKGTSVRKEKKGYTLVELASQTTFFETYDKAKAFLDKNPELKQNLYIQEVEY